MSGGGSELVRPAYGSGSLGDVVPSALAALGVDGWSNILGLPAATSYVVLLVDGLGWNLLRRHRSEAPYLSSLADRGRAITSGVPSTTATSLTSLGTALPPGAHGVVGFTSRIPGTNRLLDALRWDARVDPMEWQPHPTAFERAAGVGVAGECREQADVRGLRTHPCRPARGDLRRRRPGRGADRRDGSRRKRGRIPDLRVRR